MAGTNNRRTGQGRRSAEARAVITAGPGIERPKPPEAFSKAERAHWHRIVDAMPVEWFAPECVQLLVRLCALLVMAAELEAKWRAEGLEGRERRTYLSTVGQIGNISTKLRLSPQSRYTPANAHARVKH